MKHLDANTALAFIEGQRVHIETEVNKTIFPEVQYAQLIPIDNSAPEWTRTITVKSAESWGQADWINGNADDIPLAGNKVSKSESTVQMAGIGYGYGYEELQASIAYGVNLPNDDAIAARETYERFVDKVAFVGDESKGMQGLINAAGVVVEAATAKWRAAATTEDKILADINKLLGGTATATGYALPADTLLLPFEIYTYLASTPLANKSGGTLLTFIRDNNVYTALTGQALVIRAINRLDEGAANGTDDRAAAYSRNPRVVKMHIPMAHRFLPTYQTGALNFVVPGIFRIGGVEIRNKDGVRYMDGI